MANKTICNVCGKEFGLLEEHEGFGIHTNIGSGSICGGVIIDLNLCCRCFDEIFEEIRAKCIIDPIVR